MKRVLPVFFVFVFCIVCFVVPVSAAGAYPSYGTFSKMYDRLPVEYDGYSIVVDDSFGYCLYAWDTDKTDMRLNGSHPYTFYIHSDSSATGRVYLYSWDSVFSVWEYKDSYGYSLAANLKHFRYYERSDFIYCSIDLIHTNNVLYDVRIDEGVYGVAVPVWHSLVWDNYRGNFNILSSEFLALIPVVLPVAICFLAIRKGLRWFFVFLRSV